MKPERWFIYYVLDTWRTGGMGREEAPSEVEGMDALV